MARRYGFTLAEVLITLGIIGVVAAMTIPTLMNSTSGAEFKTGFKKIVSTLNQAITMNVALDSADFSSLASGNGSVTNSIYYMFTTRMNVVNTTTGQDSSLDTGSTPVMSTTGNYTLYFNDGMVFSFPTTASSCAAGPALSNWCKGVVDVNGAKKPNKLTNCDTSTTESSENSSSICGTANYVLRDRFSIRFGGQEIIPNGNGARYALYN